MNEINQEVVIKLRNWLGENGISFFTENKEKHGTVIPVLFFKYPHPVHLREGMQVRNFLRGLDECKNWEFSQFEDGYVDYIEAAIKKV